MSKRKLEVISKAGMGWQSRWKRLHLVSLNCNIDIACELDVKAVGFGPMGGCDPCDHTSTFPTGTEKFLTPQEVP